MKMLQIPEYIFNPSELLDLARRIRNVTNETGESAEESKAIDALCAAYKAREFGTLKLEVDSKIKLIMQEPN